MRASVAASAQVVKLASLHCLPPMLPTTWQRPHDELKRAQRSDVYTVCCAPVIAGGAVDVRSARGRRSSEARAGTQTRGGGGGPASGTTTSGTNEPPCGAGGATPLQDAKTAAS